MRLGTPIRAIPDRRRSRDPVSQVSIIVPRLMLGHYALALQFGPRAIAMAQTSGLRAWSGAVPKMRM